MNLKINIFIGTLVFVLFSLNIYSQRLNIDVSKKDELNFYKIQEKVYNIWGDAKESDMRGFKQFKRWENFWLPRTFPTGEFPDAIEILESYNKFEKTQKDKSYLLGNEWNSLGPFYEPVSESGQQGIGRINSVRFNPNNKNEIWIGAASGGLWKSNDGGNSWNTFPFTQFLSLGVSDIGIAPSKPQTIYVSTGDMFGSTSARNFYSIGLIKSIDGGQTWNLTKLNSKLEEFLLVGKIQVNPKNPDIVYVATNKGIYKTTDGGENWNQSEKFTFFMDLELNPGNSEIIYASTYSGGSAGVFVSTDAGETWKKSLSVSNGLRVAIATTEANPEKLYALVANTGTNGFNSLQLSTDSGQTWAVKANVSSVNNILGWYTGNVTNDAKGQGFYDLAIAASPQNEDEIYIGGINIWKSVNGGESFIKLTNWTYSQSSPYVHADQHDLVFSPDKKTLFSGNDGGINASTDKGTTWVNYNKGLNITQFTRLGIYQGLEEIVIAGAQDNGTSVYDLNKWTKAGGADGMECIIDPTDPTRMYSSIYNGAISRSTNRGDNFSSILSMQITSESGAWVTPFMLNPQNPKSIYAGYINVWKSENYGSKDSWKKISSISPSSTLTTLVVAPSDTNVIYTSSLNQLFATYDGGKKWEIIHTSANYISSVAVDFTNPKRIWLSKSGFGAKDKVVELLNGTVARNITGNLPNVPVNTIVLQPDSPDRFYIGTDVGVFVSDYNTGYWEKFGNNLPNLIIDELEIHKDKKMLYASTYGRGIWKAPISDCNAVQPVINVDTSSWKCPGDFVTISAKFDYPNYAWSSGEKTKEIKVNTPGIYSLFVTDNNGCVGRSDVYILPVTGYENIEIFTNEGEYLCPDGELEISSTSGFKQYLWSNGATSRIMTINQPGTYTVKGFSPNGCEVESEPVFIDVKPAPQKPVITKEGNILTASEGTAYQWYYNNSKMLSETSRELVIKQGKLGEYKVMVFNEYKCGSYSEPINVTSSAVDGLYSDFEINVNNNPGDGNFVLNFSLPVTGGLEIKVTDFNGKEVYTTEDVSESVKSIILDLSQYAAGIYFAKIKANNYVKLIKLIKI